MENPKYSLTSSWIMGTVISRLPASGNRSLRTSSAICRSGVERWSDAKAWTRMSAPSSSRMLLSTRDAIRSTTSCGTLKRSRSALDWRIAMRVSRSGGWMSTVSPHSKRLRSRSSSFLICLGGRSDAITIWRSDWWRALNVWKNSSCVCSARSRNWMSSISRTSVLR